MNKITMKDALRYMMPGEVIFFRFEKRKSVRTTATDLKKDEGLVFATGEFKNIIYVERVGCVECAECVECEN